MRLNYIKGPNDPHRATLFVEGDPPRRVSVSGHDVHRTARRIAHRVNTYDHIIEVLRMFGSAEMGAKMVDVVVDSYEDEAKAAIVEQRLRAMINAVDVILKGIELVDNPGETTS